MDGSASAINSRSIAIKTILLAAWRSKLSNEEWESRIRKILPKGVNGDVYDLADCILKQALIGPVPNELFISYIKHAVNCELVSHGAVLSSIAHQSTHIRSLSNQTPNRTSSLICLLEFLKSFRDRISCRGTEIDCLNLCHSLNQLIHWLLKCVLNSLELITCGPNTNGNTATNLSNSGGASFITNPISQQQQPLPLQSQQSTNANVMLSNNSGNINLDYHKLTIRIVDLCTETIHYFINRPFTKSLLFISKLEYSKEFDDTLKIVQVIQQKLANFPNLQIVQDKVPYCKILHQLDVIFNSREMHPSVVATKQLRCLQAHRIRSTQVSSSSNFERGSQNLTNNLTNDSTTSHALFNSLYSLVAFDLVLRPARPHKLLARQVAIITNFNSAPIYMTYCELIRVCLIGLIDTMGTSCKIKWAFFTYLKMPKILLELSRTYKGSLDLYQSNLQTTSGPDNFGSNQITNFIHDLKLAFERLCEYSPLLDEAEHKTNCDFFKCLVKELIKNDPGLIQLKTVDFRKFPTQRAIVSNNEGSVGAHMLLKTETFVTSMLETFDSEQDPTQLFSLLSQLVSGRQFEFTLSAAASTGLLQTFIRKLIEQNELNKASRGDQPEQHNIQALIFDITFISLAHIAHIYGPDVMGFDQQATFSKWYHDCFNNSTRINCPNEMLNGSSPDVVSGLLKQIVHPNFEIQLSGVNWREVCFSLPKVISEIVAAWNQGVLDETDMQRIMERIKSKMCFFAVVAATWLQCYIKTLDGAERSKPIQLLHNLTKASQQSDQQSKSYTERSSLMSSIIRKIYFEMVPKVRTTNTSNPISSSVNNIPGSGVNPYNNNNTSTIPGSQPEQSLSGANSTALTINSSTVTTATASTTSTSSSNAITGSNSGTATDETPDETSYQSINDRFVSILSTEEIFLANVKQCLCRGWLDHKSLSSLSSLFKMIGSECFTNLIVEQILTSHESPSDLSRAVNITFGLFHLDIEACAFALLRDTIPSWLMGEKKQALLNQPRAFALAHLTVMTIIEVFSSLKMSHNTTMPPIASGAAGLHNDAHKSVNGIIKLEPGLVPPHQQQSKGSIDSERDRPAAKRMKLSSALIEADDDREPSARDQLDVFKRIDKLNELIADLMRLFKEIMSDPVMSQRTLFPVLFLQQTVVCTRENSTIVTVHLQPDILLDIINMFSSELTFELVLAISNLSNTNSRKFAAKAMCQLAQVKEKPQV